MFVNRSAIAAIFSFLLIISVNGQIAEQPSPSPSPTAEPEVNEEQQQDIKDAIQSLVGDAGTLQNPENRAIAYVTAGEMMWKFDTEKAREFFESAAAELNNFNHVQDSATNSRIGANETFIFMDDFPRSDVLLTIARFDAELAYNLLFETRSAKLSQLVLKQKTDDERNSETYISFDPDSNRIKAEAALEYRLAGMAAKDNPELAAKIIRESLKKGLSFETVRAIATVRQIYKKDEKLANELGSEIVKAILAADLSANQPEMLAATSFLGSARPRNVKPDGKELPDEKEFKFTDSQIKSVAEKIASSVLTGDPSIYALQAVNRTMTELEKIIPERAAAVKQKISRSLANLPTELRRNSNTSKWFARETTFESILAEYPKLNNFEKMNASEAMLSKVSQTADEAKALEMARSIPNEERRKEAEDLINKKKAQRELAEGKTEMALGSAMLLNRVSDRVKALVDLAIIQYKLKKDDKDPALAILATARSMVREFPEDDEELTALAHLITGYAQIDPDQAFLLFEPMLDQISDYVHASAILSRYNRRNTTFRNREMVLRVNSRGADNQQQLLFRFSGQIKLLGKADVKKMNSILIRLQRSDARVGAKILMLQGVGRPVQETNLQNVIGPTFVAN